MSRIHQTFNTFFYLNHVSLALKSGLFPRRLQAAHGCVSHKRTINKIKLLWVPNWFSRTPSSYHKIQLSEQLIQCSWMLQGWGWCTLRNQTHSGNKNIFTCKWIINIFNLPTTLTVCIHPMQNQCQDNFCVYATWTWRVVQILFIPWSFIVLNVC